MSPVPPAHPLLPCLRNHPDHFQRPLHLRALAIPDADSNQYRNVPTLTRGNFAKCVIPFLTGHVRVIEHPLYLGVILRHCRLVTLSPSFGRRSAACTISWMTHFAGSSLPNTPVFRRVICIESA